MKEIIFSSRFKKDVSLCLKRGKRYAALEAIVGLLADSQPLPERCRPHTLSGNWADMWECHIEPDWLLIYDFDDKNLWLVRTGTHSDLF